jgi:hypothetical protein
MPLPTSHKSHRPFQPGIGPQDFRTCRLIHGEHASGAVGMTPVDATPTRVAAKLAGISNLEGTAPACQAALSVSANVVVQAKACIDSMDDARRRRTYALEASLSRTMPRESLMRCWRGYGSDDRRGQGSGPGNVWHFQLSVLMPSTRAALPQVISRRLASPERTRSGR